ncbi:MAG TPA: AAA family ATPase [Clostridia bacterium]|nr:AAA family ATPase [Clostridia bacterium]
MNLILIAGLPASGKSGFASYAGKELGIPVIVKDELKEILFDAIGFQSRAEKVKLGDAAMDLMYYMADRLMAGGSSVILDNNFESRSIPGLKRLLAAHACRLVTVRFDGDIRAIYQRFVERDQDPARHRGHILNTAYPEKDPEPYVPISCEEFERKFRERGMTEFMIGGRLITVDATSFEHYSNEELLSRLRNEME